MLQTIRSYAAEQLVSSGESADLLARHSRYHLALAEEGVPLLTGPEQALWMVRLQAAHADFRAGLRWLIERRDGQTAARLLWALGAFLWARSHIAEAARWAQEILDLGALTPLAEAQARAVAGLAAFKQGSFPSAAAHLTRSRDLFRGEGDARGSALTTMLLGHVLPKVDQLQRAPELLREAVADFESLGDRWGAGLALAGLAVLAVRSGYHDTGRTLYEQHLALARAADDRRSIGQALDGLALVALAARDHARAVALLAESLPICLEVGHTEYVAYGLEGLACVFVASQPDRGAGLLGCVQRLLADASIDEWSVRRDRFVATEARARAQIGDDAFDAAYDAGRRVSAADAVHDALTNVPTLASAPGDLVWSSPAAPPPVAPISARGPEQRQRLPGGLSRREAEVARLVAAGKTSREIAVDLVLSERTVTTHLDHIFAKLGVSSRTAVAMFALRNGLA
jgi:non-specific serine/threonine protein kinase